MNEDLIQEMWRKSNATNRAARGRYYVHFERSIVESNLSCKPPSNHIWIQDKDVQQQWWVVSITGKPAYWISYHHVSETRQSGWLCGKLAILCQYYLSSKTIPLCASPLLSTQSTSLLTLLVTKCMECFSPQQAILCDTSCATYNLTQLWHYLLGRQCQILKVKGSVPQDSSHLTSDINHK